MHEIRTKIGEFKRVPSPGRVYSSNIVPVITVSIVSIFIILTLQSLVNLFNYLNLNSKLWVPIYLPLVENDSEYSQRG